MASELDVREVPAYPRYFRFGNYWINSYKLFLCVGIYIGTLVSALVAFRSGISPLSMGIGCVACAVVGMIGARVFFLVIHFRKFLQCGFWQAGWNSKRGGWSVFGGLVIVPFTFWLAEWLRIPFAVYWDHMIWGIVVGAVFIRFGCVCNGCCGGKKTDRWYGASQHDTRGICERRIPVQWLEIGWWLLAVAGLLYFWPYSFPPGAYAAIGLAWYGIGRFWLEPLREQQDIIAGVRVNQLVAAALAISAGSVLIWVLYGSMN